jgi:mono/diheme cytochrome c family protein
MTSTNMARSVLVCAGLWLLMPWTAHAQAGAKTGPVTRAQAVELFTTNCSICHGPEGAGTPLMKDLAFKNRGKWKHGSRPQDIVATTTNGAPATAMLPFNGRLTPADINPLASLVRSFDKTLKPAGAAGNKH